MTTPGSGGSILYRASLADMVVPYGDRDPMHAWKHVLDASEASVGNLANSLTLGCDCLGEIHYFDMPTLLADGSVYTIENAICMHEEDYGCTVEASGPAVRNHGSPALAAFGGQFVLHGREL